MNRSCCYGEHLPEFEDKLRANGYYELLPVYVIQFNSFPLLTQQALSKMARSKYGCIFVKVIAKAESIADSRTRDSNL